MYDGWADRTSGVRGDDTWDGGAGADDAWSTDNNWVDDTAPANPETGSVYFDNGDLGNVNVVDQDWTVYFLRYQNSSASQAHTTDLNGKTIEEISA